MEEGEQILTNSSKYKLYDKFNEGSDNVNIYSGYCRRIENLKRWYNGILQVCYMFAKNLINLHQILGEEIDNSERCRYFNFWITNYIKKKLKTEWKNDRPINYILRGFYGVENFIRASTQNNNCYFDYRSTVTLDLWKEWKDLHDYMRNYNYILERINSDGNMCKIYLQYFDYINKIHEKYKKECCNKNPSDKCPNRMNLDYFCSDNLFNKLECVESSAVPTAAREDEKAQVLHGSSESHRSLSVTESTLEHHHNTHGNVVTNNTDYYSNLGVGLSFLGILSTFSYLYKFTSFGKWIRSKVRKKKIKVNIDQDSQNFLENDVNNVGVNLYKEGYNITFHPS
ncbi:PIR Superfamily Protein [Plasmodium ovale curtisi]|uniref:PIR Superfamily Protein n=1 Tax=Plasmodium ovale curtisi TaxID=864141 RepID=A0A1A8WNP8_PLAOA|nr:PIR Superfamily Protein [Plasmodium ovale curtisi]SBS99150.1 PIR Superfamily Protein [Plasmodium ovale curtisi]